MLRQHWKLLSDRLLAAILVDGRTDVGVLPTGQVVGLIEALPTVAEIIDGLIAEAEAVLQRLAGD